ncbi:type III secretion system inner membrane ring lipoprotein SctJ [Enterobacter cloacae]|uniref:type III secretion system inner membrane ring lipoprotein SctJ n=1 Tax=Enterobacter cloacae TaxID=550 RepID=UPI003A9109BB
MRPLTALLLIFALSACNDVALLLNLTQEQANQVIAVLQQHNVVAKKDGNHKSGYSVSVEEPDRTIALSIISQYHLPWAADVQIAQAFPESALVASPNAEQARVLSLQEQRLEQSLRMIGQVVNARIHVSYPSFSNDSCGKKKATRVGVFISYVGDVEDNMFTSQIKMLVKNSFDDVRYENISVSLFPAPVIQHAPLKRENNKTSPFWVMMLSIIALCITGAVAFFLYKRNPLPHAKHGRKPEIIEEKEL